MELNENFGFLMNAWYWVFVFLIILKISCLVCVPWRVLIFVSLVSGTCRGQEEEEEASLHFRTCKFCFLVTSAKSHCNKVLALIYSRV